MMTLQCFSPIRLTCFNYKVRWHAWELSTVTSLCTVPTVTISNAQRSMRSCGDRWWNDTSSSGRTRWLQNYLQEQWYLYQAGAHLEGEHADAGSQKFKHANTVSVDTVVRRKKSVLTASKLPSVFLCGICALDFTEVPSSLWQHSIDCTKCKIWMQMADVLENRFNALHGKDKVGDKLGTWMIQWVTLELWKLGKLC